MGVDANSPLPANLSIGVSYTVGIIISSALLFIVLCWIFYNNGDRDPWLPAGLASGMVILVGTLTRKIILYKIARSYQQYSSFNRTVPRSKSVSSSISELNLIERKLLKADYPGASPEEHLGSYRLCEEYLMRVDETLRMVGIRSETRMALKNKQDRIRIMQRKHLLAWARGASCALTFEAQQLTKISDKVEKATNALSVIEAALRIYPDELDLKDSSVAISEYIASVKVGRWVELAERAAFKGQYSKAIDRYRDALFYLSREDIRDEVRNETIKKIEDQIEILSSNLNKTD
jgi:tetratricopeptide (TPR) repeat protein